MDEKHLSRGEYHYFSRSAGIKGILANFITKSE
jgi:hypothetical protein